jgi:pimeloyl-ACP methyl ester carboxylesterase
MKQLYLLSGLGADKRVFDFLDLSGYAVNHILWIEPAAGETMEEYARRLIPQINAKNPILIGVSFGGMMAIEISKIIEVERVILISSAISTSSIPAYFKLIGKLNFYSLLRRKPSKHPSEIMFWLFGVSKKEHKNLLNAIMVDTDEIFVSWAIQSIALWKGSSPSSKIVRIHGTRDRILNFGSADFAIPGAGHLMVVTHANAVSEVLRTVLSSEQ